MNNKKIVTIILVLLAIILVWYCVDKFGKSSSLNPDYVFTDAQTGSSISVSFDNKTDTATLLEGEGFEDLVFERAISASGARYVNETENLVLWNKGDEITLFRGEEQIFSGVAEGEQTDVQKLTASVWVWQRTEMSNDEVITPRQADKFTLTFDSEGRISGTTDCNNFFGPYTLDGNKISFGALASTLMFCEGSQETEFTSSVAQADRIFFTENGNLVLLLPVDSGSIIFEKK